MKQSTIKSYSDTPFSVECTPVVNGPGTWDSTKVSIFRDENLIGEYIRNYSSSGPETFYPFLIETQWYALYSASYTATRVMKLHDDRIEDWCGEDSSAGGFCPVEFYIPKYNHYCKTYAHGEKMESYDFYTVDCDVDSELEFISEQKDPTFVSTQYCNFGFLSGCVWGDDSCWKLQYIDLSKIPEKILSITEKFGYWELPDGPLKKQIYMSGWEPDHQWIKLYRAESINLATNERC
jgi:hypothetical protein